MSYYERFREYCSDTKLRQKIQNKFQNILAEGNEFQLIFFLWWKLKLWHFLEIVALKKHQKYIPSHDCFECGTKKAENWITSQR